ncbi:ABC transporter ATP-binding protein [Halobaculum sp. EA56]|uniref:ABC transporter ATP-binding protein n=1 Tax=Halobaculum sp. EA56 TaxID=3421648 RepID=UPI003EBD9A76
MTDRRDTSTEPDGSGDATDAHRTDGGPRRPGEEPLLSVRSLRTTFETDHERVHAVDGVDFDIYEGETVGLVGESGSGKTVTARSLVGLIESAGRVHEGTEIRFRGERVGDGPRAARTVESLRGEEIAMVFQDALSALNPVYTVGNQLKEALRYRRGLRGHDATNKAVDLLESVGIPDAAGRLDEYPHQLSGGMRQRVLIAVALACDPSVLVCDEPTTALDVTTQAQLLRLLMDLQDEYDLSMLFITHDMGVIAQIADRINVMYAGEIVERAPTEALFADPKHPYTRGLLASVPSVRRTSEFEPIDGEVPTPTEQATSCRFAPRCAEAGEACQAVHPRHVAPAGERGTPTYSEANDARSSPPASEPDASVAERSVACLLYPESADSSTRQQIHTASDPDGSRHELPVGTDDWPGQDADGDGRHVDPETGPAGGDRS